MRKIYLMTIVSFMLTNLFAQESVRDYASAKPYRKSELNVSTKSILAYAVNEDFNGPNFPPVDWSIQSPDGGSGWTSVAVGTSPIPGWQGGTITDPDGSGAGNVAFCTWNTGGTSANDQWLITPQIAVSSGDALKFWLLRYSSYNDNVDILLSTSGNNTSDFTVTLDNITYDANSSVDWQAFNYDLSAYDGQSVYIAFREHVADNVNDGAAILLDNVQIGTPEPWDAALTQLTMNSYVVLGNVDITGTIKNNGANTITDINVTWTDGTNQYTDNLTGLSIASGATYDFTHSTQLNVSVAVKYNITAWVDLANDNNQNNDTATTSVSGLSNIPVKRVVGEEAGGTWCGWCPRGLVALKDMAHNYPDTWIGISVHNGDPMVNTTYDNAMGGYVSGYPSGLVDRADGQTEVDPGDFETAYQTRINVISPVAVDVTNVSWNSSTREVTFDVVATFYTNTTGNFRTNAVILENGVTGTTSSWDQHNYYSSSSNNLDLIDWEGINWKNFPDPVPAAQMVYDHVAREILGGWNGTASSIPGTVVDGTPNTYSYSYTVPSGYNENNMKIVGLVIDQTSGEILNGYEINLLPTSVQASDTKENVVLFPNPTNGNLNVVNATGATIEVWNMLGQKVIEINHANNFEKIDLSNYRNGTFIVRIISENNTITKKINLVK